MSAQSPKTAEATAMFREAAEAGAAVQRQVDADADADALARLGARLRASPPSLVVTCGRGSSDHARVYAKYLIETPCGIPAMSAAPSVGSVYKASQRMQGALFLAIFQSGRSMEMGGVRGAITPGYAADLVLWATGWRSTRLGSRAKPQFGETEGRS